MHASVRWDEVNPDHFYSIIFTAPVPGQLVMCPNPANSPPPPPVSDGQTTTCDYDGVAHTGTWVISVQDLTDGTTLAQENVNVVCPPGYFPAPDGSDVACVLGLLYVSESASPLKFYPLVHDGYRDTTRFSFKFNSQAHVRVEVRSREGRIIRKDSLGTRATGSWSWDGRNNAGRKVSPGYYRIRAIATSGDQSAQTANVRVQVATALVTRHATKRRRGNQVFSQSTSGSCFIQRSSFSGTAHLDCFGGNYAKVTYGFSVPTRTFRYSWSVSGSLAGDDLCCTGSVTKGAYRASSKRIVTWAQVTGWRAYDVKRVRVTYYYKKRI
jgi:hypothetical protein